MSSNEALKYVSFPTQVLAKSCKMVPVMAIKVIKFGETYQSQDYAVVVLVTLGCGAPPLSLPKATRIRLTIVQR
jgi:UDP-galactose transporter B1